MSKERNPQPTPSVSEELENNVKELEHYLYALICMNESQSNCPNYELSKDFLLSKSIHIVSNIRTELGIYKI